MNKKSIAIGILFLLAACLIAASTSPASAEEVTAIKIISPSDGSTFEDQTQINIKVQVLNDSATSPFLRFSSDSFTNAENMIKISSDQYIYLWDVSDLEDGNYIVIANCYIEGGDEATPETLTLTINNEGSTGESTGELSISGISSTTYDADEEINVIVSDAGTSERIEYPTLTIYNIRNSIIADYRGTATGRVGVIFEDEDGDLLEEGIYTLEFSAPGYDPEEITLTLNGETDEDDEDEDEKELKITGLKSVSNKYEVPCWVKFYVKDDDTGDGLDGAQIRVIDEESKQVLKSDIYTNDDGKAEIYFEVGGLFQLDIYHEDYGHESKEINCWDPFVQTSTAVISKPTTSTTQAATPQTTEPDPEPTSTQSEPQIVTVTEPAEVTADAVIQYIEEHPNEAGTIGRAALESTTVDGKTQLEQITDTIREEEYQKGVAAGKAQVSKADDAQAIAATVGSGLSNVHPFYIIAGIITALAALYLLKGDRTDRWNKNQKLGQLLSSISKNLFKSKESEDHAFLNDSGELFPVAARYTEHEEVEEYEEEDYEEEPRRPLTRKEISHRGKPTQAPTTRARNARRARPAPPSLPDEDEEAGPGFPAEYLVPVEELPDPYEEDDSPKKVEKGRKKKAPEEDPEPSEDEDPEEVEVETCEPGQDEEEQEEEQEPEPTPEYKELIEACNKFNEHRRVDCPVDGCRCRGGQGLRNIEALKRHMSKMHGIDQYTPADDLPEWG